MPTIHASLMRMLGAVGAFLALTSCSGGSPQPIEGPQYSAISYEPTGDSWDIVSNGELEVLGEGCLAVRLAGMSGAESNRRVVALPLGTRLADDGSVELPNGTSVALGSTFSFGQEPFVGTVADLPSELPSISAAPFGCPADAPVILIVPLDSQ